MKTTDDQLFFQVYAFQIAVVHHKGRNKLTEGILPAPDTVVPWLPKAAVVLPVNGETWIRAPKKTKQD